MKQQITEAKGFVNERVTEVDSRFSKLEKDLKVMNGHITKVKEDVTRDMQKLGNELNNVKGEVDRQLVDLVYVKLSGEVKKNVDEQFSSVI